MSTQDQSDLFDSDLKTNVRFTAAMDVSKIELEWWEGDLEAFVQSLLENLNIKLICIEEA